jgi:F-type H+-transporting ATPase subunit b
MVFDTHFWLAVSFVILVILVYKPVKSNLLDYLDNRSIQIRNRLEELDVMRQEAANNLKLYQQKQKMIEQEINEILNNAENEIKKMHENADKEISAYINRRVSQVMEKISSTEQEVVNNLRQKAINEVVKVVEYKIRQDNNKNASNNNVMQNSLDNIEHLFNKIG